MSYATRADLEQKWGAKMVDTVADPDGSRVGIADRISAALVYADTIINGVVTVPDPAPGVVRHVAVALAMGWMNGRSSNPAEEKETGRVILGELQWAEKQLDQWKLYGLPDSDPDVSPAIGVGSVSIVTRPRTCRW